MKPDAVVRSRRDGLRIERCEACPEELVLRAVGAPPSRILKSGRRGRIYAVQVDERALCVKELLPRGIWRRLWSLVALSGNHVAWRAARRLRAAGFPTPRPLALVVGEGGRSWFVCELIRDAERLDDYYQLLSARFGTRQLHAFARLLGKFLAALHALGIFHRDLAPQNILVRENADGWQLFLVDLESVRLRRPLTLERKLRNLIQLGSMYPDPFSSLLRLRALKSYAGARGALYNPALIAKLGQRVKAEREYCRRWFIKDYGHDPATGA